MSIATARVSAEVLAAAGHDRRRFLQRLTAAAGLAAFSVPGVFAQQLSETATTAEGPFYPDKMPLDTDNDLLIINDAITPGVGEITHLTGRVIDASGQPVRNGFVEIWSVDSTGSYVHTKGRQPTGHDANFQGYGRFLTDSKGQYYFRTIKPIEYTLIGLHRTAHIHVALSRNGRRVFTTQILVNGHPGNARDMVAQRIEKKALQTILVDFKPVPGSTLGELAANFDIVLGRTASDAVEEGRPKGVAKSEVQSRG